MAKRIVVAVWLVTVMVVAGLLFAIDLAVLGVAVLVLELAMGVAIALWRPDRKGRDAAATGGVDAGTAAAGTAPTLAARPRLGTPLDPLVRVPRRARKGAGADVGGA